MVRGKGAVYLEAMLSPIAYLTCELKSRDFESRLLIAAELIRLGYYAVVGQYWGQIFTAETAPGGCYLFKSANRVQAEAMYRCGKRGHKVVAADEEALPWGPAAAPTIVDRRVFDCCDKFLALNEDHRRALLAAFPSAKGKVIAAGTARFDLLRKTKTERPRAAPYILFNLGFGFVNSLWGNLDKAIQVYVAASGLNLENPEHRAQTDDRVSYEHAALRETEALLAAVLEATAVDIVVRPHPSERADFWQEKFKDHPRVTVVERSDPIPWIQHALLMVHSDSSTGLEAAVLGTPALNLSPEDGWARRLVIRDANPSVATAAEALAAIQAFMAGRDKLAALGRQQMFPVGAARTTALAIKSLLPPPRRIETMNWERLVRSQLQREKFSVSPEEAQAAADRIFALAGVAPRPLTPLDDSVFVIAP